MHHYVLNAYSMCSTHIEVRMPDSIDPYLPLTPVAFEILLCLSTGEKHGYAILREIEGRTGGRLGLHAGSLYRAMARLVDEGLLQTVEAPEQESDRRRRYYAVTALGREVARAEALRLHAQLEAARIADLLG